MKQILEATSQGNVAHFVVAHEGVYVVQARCSLVNRFNANKAVGDEVKRLFRQYQDQFTNSSLQYEEFIPRWIDFANNKGFYVQFYPHNSGDMMFQLNQSCYT